MAPMHHSLTHLLPPCPPSRPPCQAAPDFGRFTVHDFSWARMMVASRNFGITIDKSKTDALVPFADMLNHFRPRETKWTFDQDTYCFTISTLKKLKAGHQVYDSYGKKCNSRFLLNYGFAVEKNQEANDGQNHNEVKQSCDTECVGGRSCGRLTCDHSCLTHTASRFTSPLDLACTRYASSSPSLTAS